jgi:hypothetical protein
VHSEFAQHGVAARNPSTFVNLADRSRAALDRERGFDLAQIAAVDGGLTTFAVKRVNDHLWKLDILD